MLIRNLSWDISRHEICGNKALSFVGSAHKHKIREVILKTNLVSLRGVIGQFHEWWWKKYREKNESTFTPITHMRVSIREYNRIYTFANTLTRISRMPMRSF
jgi:hypothetical protein